VFRVKAATAHEKSNRPPIRVNPGDQVRTGPRDQIWSEYVFVITARGEGWVPARHLESDAADTVVLEAYDTTELSTQAGEELEVLQRDELSGWYWCRNRQGSEGWVPINTVQSIEWQLEPHVNALPG